MAVTVVHGRAPGGHYHVDLRGEVDLTAASEVRAAVTGVRATACRDVLLELRRLTFLDVVGAHLLGEFLEVTRARGGQLTVRAPSRSVTRALEVTGLAQELLVEPAALHVRPVILDAASGDSRRQLN